MRLRLRLFQCFKRRENHMADFTKLKADIAALNTKVDELLAKLNAPPPDEQPAVDEVQAEVNAIIAKLS